MAATRSARMNRNARDRSDRPSPRAGAKRTVVEYAKQLPQFVALLWGLIRDSRVAMMDKVLLSHWTGDPEALRTLNLRMVIAASAFFLPRRIRRRLQVIGRV